MGQAEAHLRVALGPRRSVVMTERCAHLRPDLFSARDLATIDLSTTAPEPAQIVGETWAATSTNARAAR